MAKSCSPAAGEQDATQRMPHTCATHTHLATPVSIHQQQSHGARLMIHNRPCSLVEHATQVQDADAPRSLQPLQVAELGVDAAQHDKARLRISITDQGSLCAARGKQPGARRTQRWASTQTGGAGG